MQIKDEWRDALIEVFERVNPLGKDEAEYVLETIAPLIAAEVIEACARYADTTWVGRFGENIRREVPKLLGITDDAEE